MNNPADREQPERELTPEERSSALFVNLVLQQSQMALLFMGKEPHPQTGKAMLELESAQLIIDQLEMLEAKTKGNLTSHEQALMQQTLMTLRMAFVEAVNNTPASTPAAQPSGPSTPTTAGANPAGVPENPAPDKEDDSRKKFSKKY